MKIASNVAKSYNIARKGARIMQGVRKEQLSVKIPVSIGERLDAEIGFTGRSKSELVTKALEQYFKEKKRKVEYEQKGA